MTLFSPRCKYTAPGLISVHVCVFISDRFFFHDCCRLLCLLTQCVCCSAHFSFRLNLGWVIEVLRGDAENFIADSPRAALTPFCIHKVSLGGLRRHRPFVFMTPSVWGRAPTVSSAFEWICVSFLMWHLTSSHNFPRSWAAAFDSVGTAKLLMIYSNVDFKG